VQASEGIFGDDLDSRLEKVVRVGIKHCPARIFVFLKFRSSLLVTKKSDLMGMIISKLYFRAIFLQKVKLLYRPG
jgi:hypothetical protein